jgi:hypothetical protein
MLHNTPSVGPNWPVADAEEGRRVAAFREGKKGGHSHISFPAAAYKAAATAARGGKSGRE